MGACRKLLGLYEVEGLVAPRCMVAEIAAYAAYQVGDIEIPVEFARTARGYWGIVAGEGSVEVRRLDELIRDPRGHESYQPGEGHPRVLIANIATWRILRHLIRLRKFIRLIYPIGSFSRYSGAAKLGYPHHESHSMLSGRRGVLESF